MMMESKKDARKGPWTEQEDAQLVFYVNLFGDRRWDFIAQVSGLKRTGKSCRLRWVNYLHPGLKRGKMTPLEERLVLELHTKWGNRWSRIARKLPGRTDNEIKNYWRTHMRKKAQEKKKTPTCQSSSTSSSSISSSSSITTSPSMEFTPVTETMGRSFYDTGGKGKDVISPSKNTAPALEESTKVYSMDEIWKDIELSEESKNLTLHAMNSPIWDFEPNHVSLMMQHMVEDQFHSYPSYYNHVIG